MICRGLNPGKAKADEGGEGYEHYLALVTQFVINNKIGVLPYPVQAGEALTEHETGIMKRLIDDIDQRKHSPRKRSLSPRQLADRDN